MNIIIKNNKIHYQVNFWNNNKYDYLNISYPKYKKRKRTTKTSP